MLGRQMLVVAIGWDIYEKTRSALALGYVGLVQVIPVILLTLLAGHVADSISRKKIIRFTQLGFALAIFGMAAVSYLHLPISWIYALLCLYGISRSFSSPATSAILPQIIPQDIMTNALTWNTVTFQTASIIGPALAGCLIAFQKSALIVYVLSGLCAVSFFILISGVTEIDRTIREKKNITLSSLSAGLNYVWKTKVILSAITLDLLAVLLGGAVTLLPIYARDILHVGPMGLGILQDSPSVGALCMAFVLARRPITRHSGWTLLYCVAGFGLVTVGFGLSRYFWLSLILLAFAGAFDNVSMVVRAMLIQFKTPQELLGRVAAINYVFIGTSNEMGGFESGLVAHFFGPVLSVVSGGIGTVLVVVLTALTWPQLRKLDKITPEQRP